MISNLRLQQFRSYTDTSFTFGKGANLIVGPNGSGKTNLLEAILVLARGSSYRVSDAELLQFGAHWFRLDAGVGENSVRTVKLVTEPRQTKSYELDGKVYKRLTTNHTIPVVLFEPNHLQLLHGSPDLRRTYLDDILEQTVQGYGVFRRNYRRVLAQRNALLKRLGNQPTAQELFPWNLRLSELGAVMARARATLCGRLNETLGDVYGGISDANTNVAIEYNSKFPIDSYETHLLQKLESHIHEDAIRGFTTYGPHREDFTVTFDGRSAIETASRGETRTAVLALKVIELQLLEASRDQTPLLLLDDVFSELDSRRRKALTGFLQRYQTFLTTTDADVVTKELAGSTLITMAPIADQGF